MSVKTYIFFLLFTIGAGCGDRSAVENAAAGETDGREISSGNEVHLAQQQIDVMEIEIGGFQYLNLSTAVKSNGRLQLPPQKRASLSAVMGGQVKTISALEGDYVSKGQILATLEHPDFISLQEQYMAAKGELKYLEQDYHRKKSLFADSLASAKTFQQTEAEYRSRLAEVSGLKARIRLLGLDLQAVEQGEFVAAIPMRAPINGYVSRIHVNMGKYVQPDQTLFEIVDNEHIHIDLRVYEKDMARIHEKQKVIFSLATSPDSVFEGRIFALGRAFEDDPRAMVVHAEIDNKGGNLLPGMYVDARIITDAQKVRALPNDAIVSDAGLQYIFVLQEGATHGHAHGPVEAGHEGEVAGSKEHIFRKVEVNTGATDIGFTEVVPTDSIPAHARIVTKGAFYLLAEMKKNEGVEGHHH